MEEYRRLMHWLEVKIPWWREESGRAQVWLALWLGAVLVWWLSPSSAPLEPLTIRLCRQDATLPPCSAAPDRWVTLHALVPRRSPPLEPVVSR